MIIFDKIKISYVITFLHCEGKQEKKVRQAREKVRQTDRSDED